MKRSIFFRGIFYRRIAALALAFILAMALCACNGGSNANKPLRDSTPVVLVPEAPGTKEEKNEKAAIDYSNAEKGYIIVKYTGDNPRVKAQVFYNESAVADATYDIIAEQEVLPLVRGAGKYTVKVLEHKTGEANDKFLVALAADIDAAPDKLLPFLHPNQYINFTADSEAISLGQEIAQPAYDDYEAIKYIFNYVVENLEYDYTKAERAINNELDGYIPDIDDTLRTKTGICFDYAVLMVAMLRSQRLPSRLIIGYAGTVYHAWVNVYIEDMGWVDAGMIYYDGNEWGRMDPTFVSVGDTPKSFYEKSENYQTMRIY